MSNNQTQFQAYSLWMQLMNIERTFKLLDDFLSDEQSWKKYLGLKHENQSEKLNVLNYTEDMDHFFPEGVQIFRRQMVILLATYLEQINKDFIRNFFMSKPEKMAVQLLDPKAKKTGKNVVNEFEKVLQAGSQYIGENLLQAATKQIIQIKMDDTLTSIKQLSGMELANSIKASLIALDKKRNELIHDASLEEISPEFIKEKIADLTSFIEALEKTCVVNNIGVEQQSDYFGE